jgi:glutaredoxin 3
MANTRTVEIYSAGCPACQGTVDLVNKIACPSCKVSVLYMNDTGVSQRAERLGIHRVPAVVIDGKLANCCLVSAPDEQSLRAAGIGGTI